MPLVCRLFRISCYRLIRLIPIRRRCARRELSNEPSKGFKQPLDEKQKPKISREKVRQNVEGYVFTRFSDYVKNYDKLLEKKFPKAVKVYRQFFDGVKDFYSDLKKYLKVWRIVTASPNGIQALNRKELEIYVQMPRDIFKVAPTLIFSAMPMIGNAVFPLAYMYPRTFLTSHFWSPQQKIEFKRKILCERLSNNRSVLRYLQANLKSSKKHCQHAKLESILGLVGSGFHPSVESLIEVKEIFAEPPYSMNSLSSYHSKRLCLLHGLPSRWIFNKYRLIEYAFLLHNMDRAIVREGGAHNMPADAIKHSCFLRGLNPTNLTNQEMVDWLRRWIKVSLSLEVDHISLFLHLPIFLAYNHPSNWLLIYGTTKQAPSKPSTC